VTAAVRWATFDCYGTLIDWDGGIGAELARLWPAADRDALLERYHEIEPRVQLGGPIPYRQVLADTLRLLAESEGLELPPGEEGALGDSLPDWPPFTEVPGELAEVRGRGWRLVALTNSDPDFIAASLERIGVPFEDAITADRAGSYKPAHGHFERFREEHAPEPGRHVHVAASPFHDLAPAAELGIPAVWINRLGEESEHPRALELPTLEGLADTLDRLLPA
jgi:2-haloacid dehalogenase